MGKLLQTNNASTRKIIAVTLGLIFLAIAVFLFRNLVIRADVAGNSGLVRVLVNDSIGVPLATATVKITSDQTNQTITLTDKDAQGYYTATVGAGSFVIEASSDGYTSDSQPTQVEGTQSQELSFYLTKK